MAVGLIASKGAAQSPTTLIGEVAFADGKTAERSVASIDEFVRSEMARQRVPGVAIAIVNKGRTTTKGYGFANVELQAPVTDESIFQSGSVGNAAN